MPFYCRLRAEDTTKEHLLQNIYRSFAREVSKRRSSSELAQLGRAQWSN
jgi:hypothetical protein